MAAPDPIRRIVDVIVPRAVESIDVDGVVREIDVDALLRRVDVDRLIRRVDVNALLDRVDVNALLRRVDVDALLDRVDVERLMDRVDIEDIVRRAQVEALVSATAGGLGNRLLDLFRRQLVGIDIVLGHVVDRLLHREVEQPASHDGTVTGQLAGAATRLAAFLIDALIEVGMYTATVAVVSYMVSLFTGHQVKPSGVGVVWQVIIFVGLAGAYQWLGLLIAGCTLGRALAGLRVRAPDCSPLGPTAVTRRVLVYPFSFVLGIGLVGIVVGRRHRALHDMAAPSLVFYYWGDRPTQMPSPIAHFLLRQGVPQEIAAAQHDHAGG